MKINKVMVIGIILFSMAFNVFAQGMPVHDVSRFLMAIENFFTVIDQLEANYAELEGKIKEIEQTAKQFEAYDFNEFGKGGNIKEMFRGSLRSTMTYVNKMNNLERDIENLINAKGLKLGNQSFSITDIITNPGVAMKDALHEGKAFVALDPFMVSDEEVINFYGKYGLNKRNYLRMQAVGELMADSFQKVAGRQRAVMEERIREASEENPLITEALDTDSEVKVRVIKIKQEEDILQTTKDIEEALYLASEMQLAYIKSVNAQRELAQSVRAGNNISLDAALVRRLRQSSSEIGDNTDELVRKQKEMFGKFDQEQIKRYDKTLKF